MSSFQRKIGAERSILMFPFNVVMVARVRGSLNEAQVASALAEFDPAASLCHVYVPHTTAAVVVNEAADPDVAADLAAAYQAMVPKISFAHAEGNSDSHLLATLLGDSVTIPVENGRVGPVLRKAVRRAVDEGTVLAAGDPGRTYRVVNLGVPGLPSGSLLQELPEALERWPATTASRLDVGSSRSRMSGCLRSSRQRAMRRRSPPESTSTAVSPGGQRRASIASSSRLSRARWP